MGTPWGPKYIPYTYMDPLGDDMGFKTKQRQNAVEQLRNPSPELLPSKNRFRV